MDILLGMINTGVLIASSLTVVLAVHAAQQDRRHALVQLLVLTILLGLVFLGIKSTEYLHKFHENLVPGSQFLIHRTKTRGRRRYSFLFTSP